MLRPDDIRREVEQRLGGRFHPEDAAAIESVVAEIQLALLERYATALKSIQAHAQMDDNSASMVWTARVALYPQAIEQVPAALREIVAERFKDAPDV